MRDHAERLGSPALACVSFAQPRLLQGFERRIRPGVPLYGDPDRATYAALGFGRGSVARVWLDPRSWAPYARALLRGERLERPGEDTLQLGGDVVIAPDATVAWVYHSRGPEDRPSLERLGSALAEARAGAGDG